MQVETVAAEAAAPPPVVESTPAPVEAPVNTPDTPEAREAAINDELSAVWDKQLTNGVEKGQDGRFVAKNGEAKPEPNSADQPQAAQVEPAKPAIEAPQSWSAEARAHWAKLPPEAQQYIAQREGEAHKEITSRGEKLKAFEPLDGVLQSYKDDLSRRGVQPAQAVAMLLEAQRKLDADPLGGLVNIGLTYGIDLRPLLNGQAPQVAQPDPRVQQLEARVNELLQQVSARQQQEEQQVVSQAEALVTEFKKDKPYFQDVETEMLALIPALRQRHPEASHKELLQKAYESATYANPAIRERILTDQRKTDEEKRAKEAAERAEEARKSGRVNVRSGTAKSTPKTMDEDIEALASKFFGPG
jgi:hypothetical protein